MVHGCLSGLAGGLAGLHARADSVWAVITSDGYLHLYTNIYLQGLSATLPRFHTFTGRVRRRYSLYPPRPRRESLLAWILETVRKLVPVSRNLCVFLGEKMWEDLQLGQRGDRKMGMSYRCGGCAHFVFLSFWVASFQQKHTFGLRTPARTPERTDTELFIYAYKRL